jgi:hypothetical protein
VSEEQAPEKMTFESTDFKFTAAYQAYSKAFNSADPSAKVELNKAITTLHEKSIGYDTFYAIVNRYIEGSDKAREFRRARIEGTRKQEYQKDERKKGRNDRYRG